MRTESDGAFSCLFAERAGAGCVQLWDHRSGSTFAVSDRDTEDFDCEPDGVDSVFDFQIYGAGQLDAPESGTL